VRDYPLEKRTIGHILADKAERNGTKTWLVWQGRAWSYADLHLMTNRYANGFARLGIAKGVHVSVLLPNRPEYFGVVWGLGKAGAVAVPLNTAAKGELLRYFIEQSESQWLIVAEEWGERVAEIAHHLKSVRGCLWLGDAPAGNSPLSGTGRELLDLKLLEQEPASDRPVDLVRYSDPHLIMYTSGTTGPSKGIYSPHAQAHAVGRHLVQNYGYRADDVLYTCLPLFHGNAFWYTCYPALWADATLAVSPRFSVSRFWDEIRQTGATQFNALGTMINLLLRQPPSPKDKSHRVRQCMALPLSLETFRDFGSRFGLTITSLFALTETFPTTLFTADDPAEKGSSAGLPRGYADICIVDDEDRPLPAGQIGEICVRPKEPWIMMLCYYKMPEATAGAMRNMWFHTGDRGYVDEDGYLFFVDRKKEAIRRRGENISAYELEMIVARHPKVLEVAAVPVKSEFDEDEVLIYVVPRPGVAQSFEELIHYCSANMAYFMVPRFIHFIDALPKTASEKIEKYKLKSWAEQNREQLWDREKAGIKVVR
jgi:crotonobetaine/carnitine-CoA ligase